MAGRVAMAAGAVAANAAGPTVASIGGLVALVAAAATAAITVASKVASIFDAIFGRVDRLNDIQFWCGYLDGFWMGCILFSLFT
jgi:hypothetical protein